VLPPPGAALVSVVRATQAQRKREPREFLDVEKLR